VLPHDAYGPDPVAGRLGCFGCFGPADQPATPTLIPLLRRDGLSDNDITRVFATFNVAAPWQPRREPR